VTLLGIVETPYSHIWLWRHGLARAVAGQNPRIRFVTADIAVQNKAELPQSVCIVTPKLVSPPGAGRSFMHPPSRVRMAPTMEWTVGIKPMPLV